MDGAYQRPEPLEPGNRRIRRCSFDVPPALRCSPGCCSSPSRVAARPGRTLDAVEGILSVDLSDEELARRKAKWSPRETQFGSGAIWKYAQQVGPARYGALTHPGAKGEKECYADI